MSQGPASGIRHRKRLQGIADDPSKQVSHDAWMEDLEIYDAAAVLAALGVSSAKWAYADAGADAAPAMAVNTFYRCDISAYTGDRTATLPAVAAVGDRIGIFITEGDTAFELLITAASGDTLNLVAGGTEWSRLFIRNECVILRCIVANATWIVEYDGRIAQKWVMRLSTSASAESANTDTQPTAKSGVWTADLDNASLTTVASDRGKTRRAGTDFLLTVSGRSTQTIADQQNFYITIFKNGTTDVVVPLQWSSSAAQTARLFGAVVIPSLAVDDFLVYTYASQAGTRGLDARASPQLATAFGLTEVLG